MSYHLLRKCRSEGLQENVDLVKALASAHPSYVCLITSMPWCKVHFTAAAEFLGANVLDERPFIVTPYLTNGNARTYIQNNSDCDRQKIVRSQRSPETEYTVTSASFIMSLWALCIYTRTILCMETSNWYVI